jgi:hypothetical protein
VTILAGNLEVGNVRFGDRERGRNDLGNGLGRVSKEGEGVEPYIMPLR